MGSIGIISFLRLGEIEDSFNLPKLSSCQGATSPEGKVSRRPRPRSSRRPAIRWSVACRTCRKDTDQGFVSGTWSRLMDWGLVRGWDPISSDVTMWRRDSDGGGDEETRTPDPLLAKEMLYQLSYVPAPGGEMVGDSGLEPETSALSGQRSNQLS